MPLGELLAAKTEGREPAANNGRVPPGGQVIDLVTALTRSVAAARTSRGETDASRKPTPSVSAKETGRRRTAGKKAMPAEKVATKQQPAKNTATRSQSWNRRG
ncbi:hypothetical protein [Streptomyces sp. AK02-01A]|uniref:hypothetical protein n=1 Tax=Streptomyces sp. AK02-01A TaxID=3028648 RepID=UPI0029B5D904|nr:hypothetical protein [Streptomyces sp. AK02-01A]MDX3855927.1 hypothetical protein [Streptomyces sp. AK02-01A]